MEQESHNMKAVYGVIIILIILGGGYFLFSNYVGSPGTGLTTEEENTPPPPGGSSEEQVVVVESAPVVSGSLTLPEGFPSGIPFEIAGITEAATTHFPEQNARQLSASYKSSRSASQIYSEYLNYIQQAGYQVTEGSAGSPVRTIFGVKPGGTNLSVAISSQGDSTLVQISYLLTSI